ncbi:MAG: hypothetical protein ACJASJ_000888, partial [Candidatus Azotimanducaceae bacterium]
MLSAAGANCLWREGTRMLGHEGGHQNKGARRHQTPQTGREKEEFRSNAAKRCHR